MGFSTMMIHFDYVLSSSSFITITAIILIQLSLYNYLVIFSSGSVLYQSDLSIAILITVDPFGNGDYTNIQDAINSVPSNNSDFFFISLKPGYYRF